MAVSKASAVVRVEGLNDTLRALRRYPKEAQAELRDAAGEIANRQVRALRNKASSYPDRRVRGQAPTIRAGRDRIPVVRVGGARRIFDLRDTRSGRGKAPRAGDVLFGTEFGAVEGGPNDWRFPPRRDSYWLFETLSIGHRQVVADWGRAVDQVATKWAML